MPPPVDGEFRPPTMRPDAVRLVVRANIPELVRLPGVVRRTRYCTEAKPFREEEGEILNYASYCYLDGLGLSSTQSSS